MLIEVAGGLIKIIFTASAYRTWKKHWRPSAYQSKFEQCSSRIQAGRVNRLSRLITSFLTPNYTFRVLRTHICFIVLCDNQETAFGVHRTLKLTQLSVLSQCLIWSKSFEVTGVNWLELSRCCVDVTRILPHFMCTQSTV